MNGAAFRRMAKRRGEAFTLTTWTTGAEDEYGDVAYTPDATPPTIMAVRIDARTKEFIVDETGTERMVDMSVMVPVPMLDTDGNAVALSLQQGVRPPILRDAAGVSYTVVGMGREGEQVVGARRIYCTQNGGG